MEVDTKRCPKCETVKPMSAFASNRARKDGLQSQCRACTKAIDADRWKGRTAAHQEAKRERRKRRALDLLAYLEAHPCVDCGEGDPIVLEFDHLRDKACDVTEMARRGYSWARILAEIAKCEVVCANCHRRRTARRGGHLRWARRSDLADIITEPGLGRVSAS